MKSTKEQVKNLKFMVSQVEKHFREHGIKIKDIDNRDEEWPVYMVASPLWNWPRVIDKVIEEN